MPHIDGGALDNDVGGDEPVETTPDQYVDAVDGVIAALASDSGLTTAEINLYLPTIKTVLQNLAAAMPGAGNVVGAVLKVLPNQLP